jgi:hypothetical protein
MAMRRFGPVSQRQQWIRLVAAFDQILGVPASGAAGAFWHERLYLAWFGRLYLLRLASCPVWARMPDDVVGVQFFYELFLSADY